MYARFSPVSLSGLVETAADTFTATALGVGGATSTAYPLNVTGSGHISGSLTVDGSMNVSGTTTTTNTAVVVSEQMNITNTGTGPALQVIQQGAQPVATFVDGEGAMAMKIWDNGLISLNSSVQPANQLEISGNVKILGTGSFIGNLSGNATTASSATTAAACTGNAATATTAAACTGNAATATTAAACTGNAATVTTLTSTQIVSALGATPLYAVPGTVTTLTNFSGGLQSGGLTVLNTGSSVNYSQLVNFPVNTNNYWAANLTNVWLANAGNVGIGTSSPVSPLTVYGTVSYAGIGTASSPLTLCTTSGSSRLYLGTGFTANIGEVGYIQSSDFYSSTEHPMPLTLNPNGGYVGIGKTAPTVELDVNGAVNATSVTATTMTCEGFMAQHTICGGGNVKWSGGYLYFDTNIVIIPLNSSYNSAGVIYFACPTSGTIDYYQAGISTLSSAACTSSGIPWPLGSGFSLYFRAIPGGTVPAGTQSQLVLVDAATLFNYTPTSDWLLIATSIAESGDILKWLPGPTTIPANGIYLVSTGHVNQQSGTLTVASATYYTGQVTATLTFPVAFGTTPNVTGTLSFSVTGVWQLFLGIQSISTTGVVFTLNNSGGTASPATIVYINWIATV